jgi:hypothetical protein
MKVHTRRAFLGSLCLAGVAGSAASELAASARPLPPLLAGATQPTSAAKNNFLVFDGLLYSPMPDLRSLGMPKLLSAGNLWRPNFSHQEVDPAGIEAAVRFIHRLTDNYYFDLEEWTVSGAPQSVIDANIQKLTRTAQIARNIAPQMKFGFYDIAPRGTYWPILLKKADELTQWHEINKRSAVIAAKVDYAFPSLYTFYNDPPGWEVAARAVLKEAKQYGKPVYPFLWPEFHDSNATLRGTKIPRDFWRRELEVCRQNADGLVLWGGYKQFWDEEAEWWLETKSFLSSLGVHSPAEQPTGAAQSNL